MTVAVINLTTKLKEKSTQENDFYQVVSKRLQTLSKTIFITPYLKIQKDIKKHKKTDSTPTKKET